MIKNKPEDRGQHIEDLRNAFEHRAAWFYLMYKEAKKRGLMMNLPIRPFSSAGGSTEKTSIHIPMISVYSTKNL